MQNTLSSPMFNTTQFCDEAELVIQGRAVSRIRPQSNLDFTVAYTAFGFAFNFVCLLLCLAFWHRYEHTRVRPLAFVILAVLSSTCLMCFAGFLIIFNDDYPCFLGPFFLCLTIPYAASCIIGRLILYTFHTQLSFATSKALKHRGTDLSASSLGVKTDGGEDAASNSVQWQITNWQWLRILSRRIMFPTTAVNNEDEFRVLKYLLTRRGIFVMVLGFTLPMSIVVILVIVASNDRTVYWTCYNCGFSNGIIGLTIGFGLVYLGKGMMDAYLLRGKFDTTDAWGLKQECLYSLFSGVVLILGFVLTQYDPAFLYPYSHAFMLCLGSWMFVASQSIVQLAIAARAQRLQVSKQRTAMVTVDAQLLERVLQSEDMCAKFERHLIAEFAVESLYFLKDVQAWRTSYYSVTETTRVARAKRIFKAYVAETGLYAVNISSKASGNVQQTLATGEANVTLFDEAYGEIVVMLITGSLIRFAQQNIDLISVTMASGDDEEESAQHSRHKSIFVTRMGRSTRQVGHSSLL